MTIAAYSDLQNAVADWIERADLNSRIPDFIMLAEAKFNRVLRCQQQEGRSTTSVNLASTEPQFITLPTDFQMMKSLRLSSVTGKPRVSYLTSEQLDDYRTGVNDQTGRPVFFTVFGTELELAPTPDLGYTLEMIYRKQIPALSTGNTTNWLLTLAPDAYLYGALLEASPYISDNDKLPIWLAAFKSVVDSLNDLTQQSKFSAGPLSMYVEGVTP